LDDGQHVHYLNLDSAFLEENGGLSKEVMPDFLHPKEKGYAIWAEAMEAKLCELGGWKPIK
ncbi:MAG: acetylglucosamine-6-sulfatase, partial [Verrucomicrobiales bacterium]